MSTISNLAALAEDAAQRQGLRKSLLFQGEFVDNITILKRARRLQRAFSELDLEKGKVGALCMSNHPMVYSVFGGIFRTGATAAPVMFQLSPTELRYIFSHTEAHCVVTDALLVGKVREAVEGLDHVKTEMSPFKAPSKVYFIDALPKSGVGKILRRELRDRLAADAN